MIPKGKVFFDFRKDILDIYLTDTIKINLNQNSLSEWLSEAYFSPISGAKDKIDFEANKFDLSLRLINDTDLLLNQASEQLIEIIKYNDDKTMRSDAWAFVTLYYFGFFSAQAFLRLIGTPNFFINQAVSISLTKATGYQISSGAYKLEKIEDLQGQTNRYRISKSKLKIHEATWNLLFYIFEKKMKLHEKYLTSEEILFYNAFLSKNLNDVYSSNYWASELRNKINYRPGFAFRIFENVFICKTKNLLNSMTNVSQLDITSLLNTRVKDSFLDENDLISNQVQIAHNTYFTIFLYTRELLKEIWTRRNIESTHEKLREKAFLNDPLLKPAHKILF